MMFFTTISGQVSNETDKTRIKNLVIESFDEIWSKLNSKNIDKGDQVVLDKLAASVGGWVKSQTIPVAVNQIQDLFTGDATPKKISPEIKKLEDKFKSENFDLINWFVISNK